MITIAVWYKVLSTLLETVVGVLHF